MPLLFGEIETSLSLELFFFFLVRLGDMYLHIRDMYLHIRDMYFTVDMITVDVRM